MSIQSDYRKFNANPFIRDIMTIPAHKYIISLIATVAALIGASAQEPTTLFPYPTVPDSRTTLTERADYFVTHFWDRANIKQSFSTLSKLNKAFGDWAELMPYSTADTVHAAIDKYIAAVVKTGGDNTLEMGKIAHNWFACDTAQYSSEELYLPFCRAVAQHKKIPSAERARFQAETKILENSSIGKRVADFQFITPQGEKKNLYGEVAPNIILFFNDPDCMDCIMAKTRFSADYHVNSLIDKGLLKIISIYPGEASDEWRGQASRYPENWTVGAADGIDEFFNLEEMPSIYYLTSRHRVKAKNLIVDNLLRAIQLLDDQQAASPAPANEVQPSNSDSATE